MPNILEWSSVNMTLKVKSRTTKQWMDRPILINQSGRVCSGQLLAIMGPTGCGKTSLMNVLGGKVAYSSKLQLTGNLYYNGEFKNYGMSSEDVAYVQQNERLFDFLTVRETLQLSAYFHAAPSDTSVDREFKVQAVIRELSLTKAADTILGNETIRGVSGGEYQRVLIGKELIKNPHIIFLDEPTSGLDSFQALSVMETMKKLALNSRIVIAVIHQPRSSIFALFDRLLLLSEGRLVFFGPMTAAIHYFAQLGHVCPQHFNPADYFLDILSIDQKTTEGELVSRERVEALADAWVTNQRFVQFDAGCVEPKMSSKKAEKNEDAYFLPSKPCTSWFSDFAVLFWRSSANIYRNYVALLIRGATSIFFAILVSLIYRDLGYTQADIQNRAGLIYFVLINQGFSPLITTLSVFPPEKTIVTREVIGGDYLFSSYYIGRILSDFPFQILISFVYSTILYWTTGLNPQVDRYLIFVLIIVLATLNAASLGYLISSFSPNAQIANAIGPPIFIILLLYGGFYINSSSLPIGSAWVKYLSLVYWGFQALIINEFSGETFECDQVGCITEGDRVVERYAFANGSIVVSIGVLIALTVGFSVLGYFCLLLGQQRYMRLRYAEPKEEKLERPGDNTAKIELARRHAHFYIHGDLQNEEKELESQKIDEHL